MPKMFVSMPFGPRPAAATHGIKEINFDRVYFEIIRPVAIAAGWTPLRIDELSTAGAIEHQVLREIFESELMLADISLPNGNVYYELGLRSGISSGASILIACHGTELPFDIRGQRVIFYHATDVTLAQKQIADAIRVNQATVPHNPVKMYLERVGLQSSPTSDPQRFRQDLKSRIQRANTVEQLIAVWHWAKGLRPLPVADLLELAKALANFQSWTTSVEVLRRAVEEDPSDFEAHRQLGWHLSKVGVEEWPIAYEALDRALSLNPRDPETLGIKGGLFKRQQRYTEAAECYAQGAAIAPTSLYMRVNAAALAVLQTPHEPEKGINLYQQLRSDIEKNETMRSDPWAELVLAEATFAAGDIEDALRHKVSIFTSSSPTAVRSTIDQLRILGSSGFRPKEAEKLAQELEVGLETTTTQAAVSIKREKQIEKSEHRIVHLSDLHFGCRIENGKRVDMHRFIESDYGESLSTHLLKELADLKGKTPVIIVSGDLTYQATPEEFRQVRVFLEELCAGLGLDDKRDHVIVVPGNHDVHWASAQNDPATRFDNYVSFLESFYGNDLFRRLYPRLKWSFKVQDKRDEPHDLVGVSSINGVTYLAINSCMYESEQHHYGFVGGKQLRTIEELMRTAPADSFARVVILHHHLHPFPENLDQRRTSSEVWMDMSTIRDAGLVERRLEKLNFDLVLHGHKHKSQLRQTVVRDQNEHLINAKSLIVCGAGSTGVNGLELGGTHNHFEKIELLGTRTPNADFIRVEWRELPLGPDSDWFTSQRWTIAG